MDTQYNALEVPSVLEKSGERDRPNDQALLDDEVELELRSYQGSDRLQEACSRRERGRNSPICRLGGRVA